MQRWGRRALKKQNNKLVAFPFLPTQPRLFCLLEAEVEASGDAGEASIWGGTSDLLPVDVEAEASSMLVQPPSTWR